MKLSCTQENLNQGLFVTSHVAGKNTNLPILNNVLLQATEGGIKLSATNLELGVSCFIRAKIEKEGEFTIPSKILADYVNLLPKKQVDLEVKESDLKVLCDNYKTKIRGMTANDFPLIPQIEQKEEVLCSASDFKTALSQVIFAASNNETRPEISGILLNFKNNGELILTATDSYRLAEKKVGLKKGLNEERRVIVPAKTMQELFRILSGFKFNEESAAEDVSELKIFLEEGQILFVFGNIELISRLVEGQYPDYEQIIPKECKIRAMVNIQKLVKAIKTASLFSRSGIYDIHLNFNSQDKKIIVSAINNQLGENTSEVEADVSGDEGNIILSYRYLLDGLNSISAEEINMELSGPDAPCLIKSTKDNKYLYIVMPIKQ